MRGEWASPSAAQSLRAPSLSPPDVAQPPPHFAKSADPDYSKHGGPCRLQSTRSPGPWRNGEQAGPSLEATAFYGRLWEQQASAEKAMTQD